MRYVAMVVVALVFLACERGESGQVAADAESKFVRQMREYDDQLARASAQIDLADRQLARYDALLTRWEAQTDRFARILDALEATTRK